MQDMVKGRKAVADFDSTLFSQRDCSEGRERRIWLAAAEAEESKGWGNRRKCVVLTFTAFFPVLPVLRSSCPCPSLANLRSSFSFELCILWRFPRALPYSVTSCIWRTTRPHTYIKSAEDTVERNGQQTWSCERILNGLKGLLVVRRGRFLLNKCFSSKKHEAICHRSLTNLSWYYYFLN